MKKFKITKGHPPNTPRNSKQRPTFNLLNKTVRSVIEQRSGSRQLKRKNNSVYAESPNNPTTRFDNYFKFVKDEQIKLSFNKTHLWDRAVKTPLPLNYVPSKIDEKRRSVMEDRRTKRTSQSPYLRDRKKLVVEGQVYNRKKSVTPRMKPSQVVIQEKPDLNELQENAQKELFKGIEFFRDLGRGAHALVRSAVDWKNNRKIAVKVYKKQELNEEELNNIEREVEILQEIDHTGIAMLYDIIETPRTINLIMEYGGGNSLHQYLRSRNEGRFEQSEAKMLFRQILDAVGYLHSKNIVHRDIKPENILLNKLMKVKIIDFGFSLKSSIHDRVVTFCGTPTYMAPQIVNKRQHIGIYADRWSLGVLLYTMLQGIYPFRATTEKQLFKKISKGTIEYVGEISQSAKNLIEKFLKLNPYDRISATDALKEPWLSN